MGLHLERTREVFCDENVSYFQSLKEINLSSLDRSLEAVWLDGLRQQRSKNLKENDGEYPCRFDDAHFLGFSTLKFVLFTLFVTNSSISLNKVQPKALEKMIKDSLKYPLRTLRIWQILFHKNKKHYLSEIPPFERTLFDIGFVETVQLMIDELSTLFPLKLDTLLNENLMEYLRVLYRLLFLAKGQSFNFLSFFKLYESKEDIELFYEKTAQCSLFDNEIVQYVNLKYESVLNCKRKIEEAQDGDYIAVKVRLQSKAEVLGFLEDRQEFICSKMVILKEKISKSVLELSEVNYSLPRTHGLSARRAATVFQEKALKTKELTEYMERKKFALTKFGECLARNEEKLYIARQYKN